MNNIILIGIMGAGKTSIGKCLAKTKGLDFVDTDQAIEREQGKEIASIFAEAGEAYFRQLETKLLEGMMEGTRHTIISVGGGLPIEPQNRPLLKQLGTVVYLKTKKETIVKRLARDTKRPLLQGGNADEKIELLIQKRGHIYEELSDVVVKTDNKNFDAIISEILNSVDISRCVTHKDRREQT